MPDKPETVELLRQARMLYQANPCHAPLGSGCQGVTVCPVVAVDHAATPYRQRRWESTMKPALRALAVGAGITDYEGDLLPTRQIIKWNARSSTEEVLAAFDKAIAYLNPPASR